MILVECTQGTKEWWLARAGIPTASEFNKIAKASNCEPSASQDKYIAKLIEEAKQPYAPEGVEQYTNSAMQIGIDREPEARSLYSFQTNTPVTEVGFCLHKSGRFGASPDGLVGEEGGVEIKCPLEKTHLKYLEKNELPSTYKCQVHGSLIVTEREWWDFVSYHPSHPMLVIRVRMDEFTIRLAREIARFCEKLKTAKSEQLEEIPF